MQKRSDFNTRMCTVCGEEVIDVRDAFTYATFPVNAVAVPYPGFVLTPADDPRKNPFAHRGDLFIPHLPICPGPQDEQEEERPLTSQEDPTRNPPTEEDPDAF